MSARNHYTFMNVAYIRGRLRTIRNFARECRKGGQALDPASYLLRSSRVMHHDVDQRAFFGERGLSAQFTSDAYEEQCGAQSDVDPQRRFGAGFRRNGGFAFTT